MKLLELRLDSRIFRKRLFRIEDFDHDWSDYENFEYAVISGKQPDYLELFIKTDRTDIIHFFENHGFRFCEFKIIRQLHFPSSPYFQAHSFPYQTEVVTDQTHLRKVIVAASIIKFEDRFSQGLEIDKFLSTKRNLEFLRKSFRKKEEFLLMFSNSQTQQLMGFQSGRFTNRTDAELFLTGLTEEAMSMNFHEVFIHQVHIWLQEKGVRNVTAVSSSINLQEMNIAFRSNQYEIVETKIGLCKWFSNRGL